MNPDVSSTSSSVMQQNGRNPFDRQEALVCCSATLALNIRELQKSREIGDSCSDDVFLSMARVCEETNAPARQDYSFGNLRKWMCRAASGRL